MDSEKLAAAVSDGVPTVNDTEGVHELLPVAEVCNEPDCVAEATSIVIELLDVSDCERMSDPDDDMDNVRDMFVEKVSDSDNWPDMDGVLVGDAVPVSDFDPPCAVIDADIEYDGLVVGDGVGGGVLESVGSFDADVLGVTVKVSLRLPVRVCETVAVDVDDTVGESDTEASTVGDAEGVMLSVTDDDRLSAVALLDMDGFDCDGVRDNVGSLLQDGEGDALPSNDADRLRVTDALDRNDKLEDREDTSWVFVTD